VSELRGAKNIVVCCDGTGNRFALGNSNVVKLFRVLNLDNPAQQVAYYHSGLGTRRDPAASSEVGRNWAVMIGLAFGSGLLRDIADMYAFLMDNFEEGDRIFLFGFSRGAFTVRALASTLRLAGLLRKGNNALIPVVVDLMRHGDLRALQLASRFKSTFPRECKPYFVGVWDTVSSVGWFYDPVRVPYTASNPDISIGRHAIAIDEHRAFFRQNLWTNAGPGQDFKQVWFAGVHSDIGGGYPESESGLSKITLRWMIQEATSAGLLVRPDRVDEELGRQATNSVAPDPLAPLHDSLSAWWSPIELFPHRYYDPESNRFHWKIPAGQPRFIPPGSLIHESVLLRMQSDKNYHPTNLPPEFAVEPTAGERAPASSASPIAKTYSRMEFPLTLIDDLRNGHCVLYAGAGLSAMAGLPVWRDFAAQLLDAALNAGVVNDDEAHEYREAVADRKTDYVVDGIVGHASLSFVQPFLRATFQTMRPVPVAYQDLAALRFAAALTTNFDNLLERAFKYSPDQVRTPLDVDQILEYLKQNQPFLLKMYGTLERPDTMLVSPAQFDQAISDNLRFREVIQGLFLSKTILFVGCSLEGIERYLRGLRLRGTSRKHYAVSGVLGTTWRVMAEGLKHRYGIEVIPYQDGSAEELENAIRLLRSRVDESQGQVERTTGEPLKRIVLENIGPFENRSIILRDDTNVFLGNNGVGKSTILRAVAATLCGSEGSPYVGRLLRAKRKSITSVMTGTIQVEFGRNAYETRIQSRTGNPEVSSPPVAPIAAEGVLALGFPPLRASSGKGSANSSNTPVSEPVAGDLLPLVIGQPDFRLDGLQDWIVSLDHLVKDEISRGIKDGQNQRLINKFFEVVKTLTEGVNISFGSVNPATKQITVNTDDGEVPLEMVSQGTASLISWVGVILQRLYEIYPADEDPTQRYFLVLMDEIDAHMHPQWQRIMLNRIRDIFPRMQLIATTHSALVIADLPWDRVFHVLRDENGQVDIRQYEIKLEKLESNQILTSPLFGLDYPQGEHMEKAQKKYAELRAQPGADPKELDELALQLFGRKAAETEAITDELYQVVQESIEAKIAEKQPQEQVDLIARAKSLLQMKTSRGK
jgi:uncharacterized protein (DUF2235 family)/predicted ATP-binding protein involved in virulence